MRPAKFVFYFWLNKKSLSSSGPKSPVCLKKSHRGRLLSCWSRVLLSCLRLWRFFFLFFFSSTAHITLWAKLKLPFTLLLPVSGGFSPPLKSSAWLGIIRHSIWHPTKQKTTERHSQLLHLSFWGENPQVTPFKPQMCSDVWISSN